MKNFDLGPFIFFVGTIGFLVISFITLQLVQEKCLYRIESNKCNITTQK